MSSSIRKTLKSLLKKVERRANYLYKYHYRKYIHTHYNNLIIENLMCNGRCHVVAVFKNYLIEDDNSEYLRRFYKYRESTPRLKKLFSYHNETSVIFPNYTPLEESQYLYNNVIRKQRIIDEQQNLEVKKNDKKSKKCKDFFNKEDKVFNSTVFGDILSQSESVLRIMFGIEKKEKGKDKEKDVPNELNIDVNDDYNKRNSDFDDSEYVEVKQLISKVENAEEKLNNENNNSLGGYKLNGGNNKPMKYKLKTVNNTNNDNQAKNKNYEKLNSISINSTNNTNSSNNNIINSNINLNRMKNNQNINFKNKLKSNKKIRNSLTITNSNLKNKEKINFINSNKNLTIPTHKHSKSHIPNKTLYGLNFHSNNNNIFNNLMNQEKKLRINNNSKSLSNNTSRLNTVANTSTRQYNNNYILNSNFPHNSKSIVKQNNYMTNNKFNSVIKSDKLLTKIPKINIDKLNIINNDNISNKRLTITNRDSNRNHNYILSNPNLFFTETEVLKTDRNLIKKRNQKKDIIKSMMNQAINSSPYSKSKAIFDRNSNRNLVIINETNLKTISQSRNNKQYFSNKTINKTPKKLLINDYNFKNNPNIINKGNSINKFYKNNYGV